MRPIALAALLLVSMTVPGCLDELGGALSGRVMPQDYLKDDYSKWVIEVDHVGGHRPDRSVLDFVQGRIAGVVNKQSIEFVVDDQLPAKGGAWTSEALRQLHTDTLDQKTGGDKVVTHLLFVDGRAQFGEGSGEVLGVTIGFDLIVIFSESVANSCRPLQVPPCQYSTNEILQAVTVHEFGHALGLVNREAGDGSIPVPQQSPHEDPEHKGHSKNQNSVMYWAVESSVFSDIFRGPLPTTFDADDKRDLCAAGGRC